MTISKKQLADAQKESYDWGMATGKMQGREEAKKELLASRKEGVIELTRAAAELAQANAKLTYAMSRIADKLL